MAAKINTSRPVLFLLQSTLFCLLYPINWTPSLLVYNIIYMRMVHKSFFLPFLFPFLLKPREVVNSNLSLGTMKDYRNWGTNYTYAKALPLHMSISRCLSGRNLTKFPQLWNFLLYGTVIMFCLLSAVHKNYILNTFCCINNQASKSNKTSFDQQILGISRAELTTHLHLSSKIS